MVHELMDAGGFRVVSDTHLFKPKNAYRMPGGGGFNLPATATIGKNPANGVVVYYSLKAKPTSDVVLEFLDSNGKSIRKFTARAPARLKQRHLRSRRRRHLVKSQNSLAPAHPRVSRPMWV